MALPFPLCDVSAAAPLLGPGLADLGGSACRCVEAALARELGVAVRLRGRPVAGRPVAASGSVRLGLPLGALGEAAALELDAAFVTRALAQLAGAPDALTSAAALAPSAGERAFLSLAALATVDALLALPAVAALAPRLALDACADPGAGALAVELELTVSPLHGRGRLLIPHRAVAELVRAAVTSAAAPGTPAATLHIPGSLRQGAVALTRGELVALAPGDVLLLDEREESAAALVLAGGLTLRGAVDGDALTVEAIDMEESDGSYPLTLDVEVARVTVTVAELARLAPGSVLALGAGLSGAAVLRAGERALARGELVELEGALGFRVLELGSAA